MKLTSYWQYISPKVNRILRGEKHMRVAYFSSECELTRQMRLTFIAQENCGNNRNI